MLSIETRTPEDAKHIRLRTIPDYGGTRADVRGIVLGFLAFAAAVIVVFLLAGDCL